MSAIVPGNLAQFRRGAGGGFSVKGRGTIESSLIQLQLFLISQLNSIGDLDTLLLTTSR